MRLVDLNQGQLELRWTWFPYWLAASPVLHNEIERLMRDVVIINGMPPNEDSLDRIEKFVLRTIDQRFKLPGLTTYLEGMHALVEG